MPPLPFVLGCLVAWLLLVSRWRPFVVLLLLLPGTAAHELAHYFVALALRGAPRAPDLVPRRESAQHWRMGEVRFEPALVRTAAVALAPLYLVPLAAWGFWQLAPGWPASAQGAAGYAFGLCAWAVWPSRTDWALAGRDPLGLCVVLALLAALASFGCESAGCDALAQWLPGA